MFDSIPITYIKKVFFQKHSVLNDYENIIPQMIEAEVNNTVFRYRKDWQYW